MADISNAFVKQFGTTLETLVQQKGSRLRDAVRLETDLVGEAKFYDQLGAFTASVKTTRHSDVEYVVDDYARRMVTPIDVYIADLIDKEDKLKMLLDPTSTTMQALQWAIGRKIDDLIIAAINGTSYTGKAGTTPVVLPAGQKIAVASSGLTLAKLLATKEKLDAAECDPDEARYIACSAKQITNLLNTTQIQSADYNTIKTLVSGQIDTFLGFKFIRTERLPVDGASSRLVMAWIKSGVLLAQANGMTAKIDTIPQKHYAAQVYASLSCGATRMEEVKIVEIACLEV
jgi:hypothetical protein